jgi:hypothetical protein
LHLLDIAADALPGTYLVQACSVGDVGDRKAPVPDELPCQRTVLEYELRVVASNEQ